ncbi:hypothetical protein IAT40_004150 [Kwoniella sp. CBS 6097]
MSAPGKATRRSSSPCLDSSLVDLCQQNSQNLFAYASATTCFCTDLVPDAKSLVSSSGGVDTCPNPSYRVQRITSTCQLSNYASNYVATQPISTTVTDPSQCLTFCSAYTSLAIVPSASANNYQCQCTNSFSDDGQAVTCQPGAGFIYSHPAQASGLARRKMREMSMDAREAEAEGICPGGLVACKVPGSTDGFERVDVTSELESCGGCSFVTFNNATAAVGTDCSTLPGVSFGASTCTQGKCEVFSCRPGYTLVDGGCVEVILVQA